MKRGDFMLLSDLQTLIGLLPSDVHLAGGLNMVVTNVTAIDVEDVCKFDLIETDSGLSVLIKRCDGLEDIRVLFAVDGVPSGDRQDWIDAGANWLFLPPATAEYSPSSLEYTEEIWNGELCYKQKCGSLYGRSNGLFACVHEWTAGAPTDTCQNPEIVVIETGNGVDRRGGFITFLQGAYVASSDIDFISIDSEDE